MLTAHRGYACNHYAANLFENAYNEISDAMPCFLSELEQIWPECCEPIREAITCITLSNVRLPK